MATASPKTYIYASHHSSKSCAKLYLDAATADVHFKFTLPDDSEYRVPAHKNILAAGSEVFHSMFYGSFTSPNEVEIVDASPKAFEEFMQFFYLQCVKLSTGNVVDVMNLTNKYMMLESLAVCERSFYEHLPIEKLCFGIHVANLLNRITLKNDLLRLIRLNSTEVFASDSFKQCEPTILKDILESGQLKCSPMQTFNACLDWSEQACIQKGLVASLENRKEQLGDCVRLIPFKRMSADEINDCVSNYKKLLDEDILADIIIAITAASTSNTPKTKRTAAKRKSAGRAQKPNTVTVSDSDDSDEDPFFTILRNAVKVTKTNKVPK